MPRERTLFSEGYREMKLKSVSGIMLTLLLTGMLTFTFNIETAKASGTTCIMTDVTSPYAPECTVSHSPAFPVIRYWPYKEPIYETVTATVTQWKAGFNGTDFCDISEFTINWGDGTGNETKAATGTPPSAVFTHNYTLAGNYIIVVWGFSQCMNASGLPDLAWCIIMTPITVLASAGYIYIRADGSVDPPEAPISSVDNVTYTFTGDIDIDYYLVAIERDNIVVDGAGYTVRGIALLGSSVAIKNLEIKGGLYGIDLGEGSYNSICGNNITSIYYGIYKGGSYNNIYGNNIANCSIGIELYGSYNSIYGNNIANCRWCGIYSSSANDIICHNNFVNNSDQVSTSNWVNVWDDGYPSGGNYWSNYTDVDFYSGPYQNETGSDGIWDHPYVIDENNRDRYPVVNPWTGAPPPVSQLPFASFTHSPTNPIIGEEITFDASSSYDIDGVIVSYKWDFDDNNITTTIDPIITHAYTATGTYAVILNVIDDGGATAMTWKIIVVTTTVPTQPPNPPTYLFQYETDGPEIPVGGTIGEDTVTLLGVVSDPDNDRVKLQIELRRLNEYDGSFIGVPTHESEFVDSGYGVIINITGLIPGYYHWQARTMNQAGATSDWVSFPQPLYPPNPESAADFVRAPTKLEIAQLITQEAIGGVPVTVDGQFYVILTLKSYIDPITLEVVPNVMTKVYVEVAENYPVSDPEIARKIGIIDYVTQLQEDEIYEKCDFMRRKLLALRASPLAEWPIEAIKKILEIFQILSTKRLIQEVIKITVGELVPHLLNSKEELRKQVEEDYENAENEYFIAWETLLNEDITDYAVANTVLEKYLWGDFHAEMGRFLSTKIFPDETWELFIGELINVLTRGISEESLARIISIDYDVKYWSEKGKVQCQLSKKPYKNAAYTLELAGVPSGLPDEFNNCITNIEEETAKIRDAVADYLERFWFPDYLGAILESPGELRVYDSQGRITGLVNGEVKEEIPNSWYYNNTVAIFFPSDSYRYEIAGTYEGVYGLTVVSVTEQEIITFAAADVPTSTNVIHQYAIDWVALSLGEEGVTVKVDSNGDGIFEHTFTSDSELSHSEYMAAVSPPPPVGGKAVPINVPINKPEYTAPWMWLTIIILPMVTTVVYVKKRKRNTEITS